MKSKTLIIFLALIISSNLCNSQTTNPSNIFLDASFKKNIADENSLGNQFIDVIHYDFKNLQILPQKKLLRANIEITIKATENIKSFYLDFHNSHKVLSVKINDTIAKWEFRNGHNIKITPEKPIKVSSIFKVEVKYYNTNKIDELWDNTLFDDDFFFTNIPNFLLFPSNEIIRDRAYFTVNITIPKDYSLATFGVVTQLNKSKYTITSKSTLSVNNFTINILRDYSKNSIDGPRLNFMAISPRVTINQYSPIDSTITVNNLIDEVPNQMAFLDSILGYYPYRNFNIVITKDIVRKGVINGRNTIIIPYAFTIDSIEANNKVLNGLVKQWFGNKVNIKNKEDLWIVDGISKYIEWLLVEQKYGTVEFNRMMNSKLVEARKYMGLINWHTINPHPIYTYDLKNVVHDFGKMSNDKIVKGDELKFLFKTISLDPEKLSDSIKLDFKKRFGHNIEEINEEGHSYSEIMSWAKEQESGNFRISADGFYTIKSMEYDEFAIHKFKLADPGDYINDFTVATRGALFIHFLRIYFGDELFFQKVLEFATKYDEKSLSTDYFTDELNKSTNGDIKDQINEWLYSDTKIPSFKIHQKKE